MALSRTGHRAYATLWFRFEHNAGPNVEGHVLHAALFFYRLNQHHTAQLVFTRLERHTAQDDMASADLDRRLQAAGLIDTQGNVAPGVQARWGWQRNFVLPTPHVLLKACPEDFNPAERIVSREIKIDVWQYPGQVA